MSDLDLHCLFKLVCPDTVNCPKILNNFSDEIAYANSADPSQIDQGLHSLPFNQVFCKTNRPPSMAQLDALLTGYQEVVGSILAGSATFFCGDQS